MIYDAVVVGAGHNGLAAAVHLAAKGWKVAVAEGNAEPGGAVKTREVTLPGFRHDLCAMNLEQPLHVELSYAPAFVAVHPQRQLMLHQMA